MCWREKRMRFSPPLKSPMDSIVTRLGFGEVLTGPSSWPEVERRLRQYTVEQVLDAAGRISAVLFNSRRDFLRTQRALCENLLAYKAPRIWDGVERAMAQSGGGVHSWPTVALFD